MCVKQTTLCVEEKTFFKQKIHIGYLQLVISTVETTYNNAEEDLNVDYYIQ